MKQFSEILDQKSGKPLLERVVLIVNTSNMPVSAREASLFSGVTIAEYFRDMGYNVAVLADSTSRWAESLREISGQLEEMPAEEGYPAYLPSKLSSFYERAGVVTTLGTDHFGNIRKGSISIIGTISPPAGDFSEPVTATTKRLVQVFWALDPKLAYLKHYPAINWMSSYSNYPQSIIDWWYERDIDWPEIDIDWFECRTQVNEILSLEQDLKHVVQLIGEKNLPEDQQLILFIAKMLKDGFLVQDAFNEIDSYTSSKKLLGIIKIILLVYKEGKQLIKRGILIEQFLDSELINSILRISQTIPNDAFNRIERIKYELVSKLRIL
jgi:V/A-type H+-transporting ATPase subunit A